MRKSGPKEGSWIARPKRPRWVVPSVTFVVLITQAPNWFNLLFGGKFSEERLFTLSAIMGLILLVLIAVGVRNLLAQRAAARSILLDDAFGDQFLVDVTIGSGKKRFGTDRGVLWFSDGLMGFSGSATSFVLSSDDIYLRKKDAARNNELPVDAVVLRGTPRPGHFIIHPIGRAAKAYRERLKTFMWESAAPEGETVWPPLVPYDERLTLDATRRRTLDA